MIQIMEEDGIAALQKHKMVGGADSSADPNGAEVAQEFPAL
jgi:hypothetical protein